MEYHVTLTGLVPDLHSIDQTIRTADPAALVDLDRSNRQLRIAAAVGSAELLSLLGRAGLNVTRAQIAAQPSVCCGGCGG